MQITINRRPSSSLCVLAVTLLFLLVLDYVPSCYSDCAVNEAVCYNKECIFKSKRCDDHFDCADKSDEGDICDCEDRNGTLFQCHKGGSCIFDFQKCDGHKDCPDGEDEMNCRGE